MALAISLPQVKSMVGKVVATNIKLIEVQGRYAESMVKRNTSAMVELADARISSLQELTSARSFSELYDNTVAFEDTLRDKLMGLYEENTAASKALAEDIKDTLEVDEAVAKAKALSGEVSDKVKSFSDNVTVKVKTFSDDVSDKVKSLSETTRDKLKGMSGSLTPESKTRTKATPKARAATAAKKTAKAKPAAAKPAAAKMAAPKPAPVAVQEKPAPISE